jgi:hypothetical protein
MQVVSWKLSEKTLGNPTTFQAYLLTLGSRVLLVKLRINFEASQEILCIYGPRSFLTVPTSARNRLSYFE